VQLKDIPARYGWISIALHWTGAIAVIMLWFIGNVMTSEGMAPEEAAELVRVHTSVAVAVYLLLLGRIVHRLSVGFPEPVKHQSRLWTLLTRALQVVLLTGIAVMLLSGPLMVWSGGEEIGVFSWGNIPSPFAANEALHNTMTQIHRTTRWVLLVALLAHVGGVFVSRDETLNRMLLAPEERRR